MRVRVSTRVQGFFKLFPFVNDSLDELVKGLVSKETVTLRRWEVTDENLDY